MGRESEIIKYLNSKIKLRKYQKNIIDSIKKNGNTLIVLPTGTGKTIIAFYMLLYKGEGIFMAPTRPLVKQHYENFINMFPEFKEESSLITGEVSKNKRERKYSKKFIFATPQIIEKDIEKYGLNKKALFIFDECHRTVGNYAYNMISKHLSEDNLIIGLTASPGGKDEKISEVVSSLKIKNIEIRTGKEEDIKEYLFNKKYHWVFTSLSQELKLAVSIVKKLIKEYRSWFTSHNVRIPHTKTELISFRSKLEKIPKPLYYSASTNYSILFNLTYFLEILETQGFHYFMKYYKKVIEKKTKASNIIKNNQEIKKVVNLAELSISKEQYHPKFYKLEEILSLNRNKKIIVFVQYVDTIELLYSWLSKKGFVVFKFMGKRKGFNKKEQQNIINKFRNTSSSILISSSVGEEGIDIPSVDIVVFFDVVPSEIRSIQRKGRAGRLKEGEIYFIITSNTVEVAFYKSSIKKEKTMKIKLQTIKNNILKEAGKKIEKSKKIGLNLKKKTGQLNLSDFI